jgi:hypothetical protein
MMQDTKTVHTKTAYTPNERKGAYMKRAAHIAYSVIGGSILLLAGMPPAPASATPAPNCVNADVDNGFLTDKLTVTNTCPTSQRVKIILGRHTDIECRSYKSHESIRYTYAASATFDRIEKC